MADETAAGAQDGQTAVLTCEQTACNIAADGKCLEGHVPVTDCPSYRGPRLSVATVLPVEEDGEAEDDLAAGFEGVLPGSGTDVPLHTGEDLVGEAVDRLLRNVPTRVIVVAGSPDSGKTTLIASLYERFQKDEYAGYRFAGSHTLPGFERRCFLARMASGRIDPVTPRTQRDQRLRFLHLAVRRVHDGTLAPPQDILFADVHGERFDAAQTSLDEARTLQPLQRADHFVLLIDCERLLDAGARQKERNAGAMLLRSLRSVGVLGMHSYVDFLFSKWDLVEASPLAEQTKEFVAHVKEDLCSRFEGQFQRIRFLEVAALPRGGVLSAGYNLDKLFPSWVEESPLASREPHPGVAWPVSLIDYAREQAQTKAP